MKNLRAFSSRASLAALWLMVATGCGCCTFGDDAAASVSVCDEDEEGCAPRPDDCVRARPGGGSLALAFSRPLPVEVRVYEGEHFETGRLAKAWTPLDTAESLELPFGRYAATALYVRGGDTIQAVDGDGIQVQAIRTCSGDCWEVSHGKMDLELRE